MVFLNTTLPPHLAPLPMGEETFTRLSVFKRGNDNGAVDLTSPIGRGARQRGKGMGYLWGTLKLLGLINLCWLFTTTTTANAQISHRVISPDADQTTLTIYPENLALITETRTLDLPVGKSTIVFEGVNERMIPASVLLRQFSGLTIERNFDAELLSKANLFERSIGQTVTLTRTDKSSGIVRAVRGKIVSAKNGVVFDVNGKMEAYQCSGLSEAGLFDKIPEGLNNKPELSIDVDTTTSGPRELVISYLADGFSWAADYRLDLKTETQANFNAWLTFKNDTAQTFKNTQTSVVAGALNRSYLTKSPRKQNKNLAANCWPRQSTLTPIRKVSQRSMPMVSKQISYFDGSVGYAHDEVMVTASRLQPSPVAEAPAPPEQEELSEYKLYRIPAPINLASYQTKQIRFLHEPSVKVAPVYTFEESWNSLRNPNRPLRPSILETRLDNGKDGKLGKPLPSGTYRVMSKSNDGKPIILGIDNLENRAVDLPVKIKTNTSRNVQMETRVTSELIANNPTVLEVEHLFTNALDIPVTIEFKATGRPNFQYKYINVNGYGRNGQVISGYNGAPYKVKNPSIRRDKEESTPTWTFTLPANSTKMLTYTAESQ